MRFEQINPFVRFATRQSLDELGKVVNYDHRFYYGLNGSGVVTINGKSYSVKKDTFLMWRAGSVYSYRADGLGTKDAEVWEIISGDFDFTRISENMTVPTPPAPLRLYEPDGILSENAYFENTPYLNSIVYIPSISGLSELMFSLQAEFKNGIKYQTLKLATVMQEILLKVVRFIENDFLSPTETLVSDILRYLQTEYVNNPTNKEIGDAFGYHPNYINSLIVKYTGTSIHNYLLRCKMNKAIDLLMTSNMSVREIAEEVNIPDPQYFSRIFKKFYHKAPTSFRKK